MSLLFSGLFFWTFYCFKLIFFICAAVVQMLHCQVCCETFHRFCLEPSERPLEENKENWCCRRCKFCRVCGRKNKESKVVCQCLCVFVLSYIEWFWYGHFVMYSSRLSIDVSNQFSFLNFNAASTGVWKVSELLPPCLSRPQLPQTQQT